MSCDALSEVIPCFMNDRLENNFTAGLLPPFMTRDTIYHLNFLRSTQRKICSRFNLVNAQFITQIELASNLINRSSVNVETLKVTIISCFSFTATAIPYTHNIPTDKSCVNWNQYYTNCSQLGDNPFQGTISFDNIGLAWVAIFLVIITF